MVVLAIVVLAGCQQQGGSTGSKLTSYIGGTNGLALQFNQNEPPKEVLDNGEDPFFISLLVENKGEYTIPPGGIIATLSGISREAFSLQKLSTVSDFELLRRTKVDSSEREGGTADLSLGQANYKYDLATDFSTRLLTDVCYNYRTVASTGLCFKGSTIQRSAQDVCTINNEKVAVESSSAPIQVTEVKERASGSNQVTFTFVIENQGEGEVYELGSFTTSCTTKQGQEGKVNVKVESPSTEIRPTCGGDLQGSHQGVVRLIEKKRTISCSVNTGSMQETAFSALVDIQIDYIYKNSLGQDIKVKNAVVL